MHDSFAVLSYIIDEIKHSLLWACVYQGWILIIFFSVITFQNWQQCYDVAKSHHWL